MKQAINTHSPFFYQICKAIQNDELLQSYTRNLSTYTHKTNLLQRNSILKTNFEVNLIGCSTTHDELGAASGNHPSHHKTN